MRFRLALPDSSVRSILLILALILILAGILYSTGVSAHSTIRPSDSADNQTPIARDDSYTLHTGGYIGRFTNNDWEPDGDSLIYHPVSGPSHGTLSYDSGVNYPDPHPWYNPNVGFAGTDSLTYQICDTFGACATATVTITVTNQAPIAREDSYTVHNPGYIGRFTTNDWEPDGDSLTYNLVTPPSHGQLYNDYGLPDPRPWYVPNPGFSGLDTIVL
jgi:hypothetical protein